MYFGDTYVHFILNLNKDVQSKQVQTATVQDFKSYKLFWDFSFIDLVITEPCESQTQYLYLLVSHKGSIIDSSSCSILHFKIA